MRFVLFYHSIASDWNHGNAHFLRGIVTELMARGHDVVVHEPADAWSYENLVRDHGTAPIEALKKVYPALPIHRYDPALFDVEEAVDGADVVMVHEWNSPELVRRLGDARRRGRFVLLFHDTHHRAVSAPEQMAKYDLSAYDAALVFGEALRQVYLRRGWVGKTYTWHEAADTRVFRPLGTERSGDLVWVGNWGDGERSAELAMFLMEPVRTLSLDASAYGVRYPSHALTALRRAGITHRGWLPNPDVPRVFAANRITVHVPRRWYVEALPGIPTIRPFEALACGIPLVTGPWDDVEGLFREGTDYLSARDGAAMRKHLRALLLDPELACALVANGRERILARHTCVHRVDELLAVHGACTAGAADDGRRRASGAHNRGDLP